ncbi:MAG: hypothetical protein HQM13_13670 [SAR324 cluster bacterium]|nr:hypothetical protein [SAR324 cluster bacterium]
MAVKAGFKNVKVYSAGIPDWKKKGQLVQVKNTWLAKNLDEHHVILDVRPGQQNQGPRIKSAVSFESTKIVQMNNQFKKAKTKSSKKILPNLADKKAPIILYGNASFDADVMKAYQTLVSWRYSNVSILDGGISEWSRKKLPMQSDIPVTKINYVRKLVKGAIPSEEFAQFYKLGKGLVLDVRSEKESSAGKLENAMTIPLDDLEANYSKLPRNEEIVIHCGSGVRAQIAYNFLKNKGYQNVRFLNNLIKIDRKGNYQIN